MDITGEDRAIRSQMHPGRVCEPSRSHAEERAEPMMANPMEAKSMASEQGRFGGHAQALRVKTQGG